MAKKRIMLLPFQGVVKQGTRGRKARAIKRALRRAGYLSGKGGHTPLFGRFAVSALKQFQKDHGLTPSGQVDRATLKKLGPHFDQYAFFLYVGYPPGKGPTKEQKIRQKIVAYAMWAYNNRFQIHYLQYRPMDHLKMSELKHLPLWDDCSEFATKAYKFAGAPDPNGRNYNGYGWTGDMLQHGKMAEHWEPGDLAHYGPNKHVAVYIGNGTVISHGSEGGPYLIRVVAYRPDFSHVRNYLDN